MIGQEGNFLVGTSYMYLVQMHDTDYNRFRQQRGLLAIYSVMI